MTLKQISVVTALIALALLAQTASAQITQEQLKEASKNYYEWGVQGGANFEQLVAYPFTKSYSPGFMGGAYIKHRKNAFGVELGINLNSATFTTENPAAQTFNGQKEVATDTVAKGDFTAYTINVPLIVEYKVGRCLSLQMGAAYNYIMAINDNNGAYSKIWGTDKIFKATNFSALAGLEFIFSEQIRLKANYSIGFLDINNGKFQSLTDQWRVMNGQVSLLVRVKKWYPKHF